ncbi:MAG: toll/interleukin-1 receptor domain-containing protein [Steroidobacteraceae bacterium]
MTAAPDVFLSCNREDQAVARRFAEGFGREGLDVWWDQTLRSGEAYDQVTGRARRNARAAVVPWSRKSVGSRWVREEPRHAASRLNPEVSARMFSVFKDVWLDTPREPPTA